MERIRKSYVETRDEVLDLDQILSMTHLIDAFITIAGLLLQIYVFSVSKKYRALKTFSYTLVFGLVLNAIKLVLNCLINGKIHDASDKMMACLDNIKAEHLDDAGFKETLLFMSSAKELKFGFTIAGLMPLRKTTLLSVKCIF